MKKLFPLFYFLLFTFEFVKAQAPQATSYQAVIRNSSGNVLSNQLVKVRFSIHDSAANGTVVYQETQTPTTNAQGLINLFAGQGTAITGTFAGINWGNKSKFLQTEIDITGGNNYTDMGTMQLMSVPYALYSNNGLPTGTSNGDILYWNGASWVKLPIGNYGQTLSSCDGLLTWGGCVPKVNTNIISDISNKTANCGGTVTTEGGTNVNTRGVCWSTSINPTVVLSTKTTDGVGVGSFTSNISGLIANTTYYVRAYATNSVGTSYGSQQNFTTARVEALPSVTIGSQIWSSKNIDVRTYRNGDEIPQVTNNTQWNNLTSGAWCWYNNDSVSYADTYGKLYNWYAVNDPRGFAPIGWHVPTDGDWNTLSKYIDNTVDTTSFSVWSGAYIGTKLKNTSGWSGSGNGTNIYNFSSYPAGYRGSFGTFNNSSFEARWWNATEYNEAGALHRNLIYNSVGIMKNASNKANGLSVRVVRD